MGLQGTMQRVMERMLEVSERVAWRAGVRVKCTFKCLDDTGCVGSRAVATAFYNKLKEVAGEVGVRLAPAEDPAKMLRAAQQGVILGIHYDTRKEHWKWAFEANKVRKLKLDLWRLLLEEKVSLSHVKTVNSKLTHYAPVINVVMGRWERGYLLHMDSGKQSWSQSNRLVTVMPLAEEQARWWLTQLEMCTRAGWQRIPCPLSTSLFPCR